MTSLTSRFGFTRYGGPVAGNIGDDGAKFTLADRDLLDHLLTAFESHAHAQGVGRLADPAGDASATVGTTGGSLAAGQAIYYVVTYVDQYGLETAASDEISVTTPQPLSPPDFFSLETVAGGSLAPGSYSYAVSVVADTDESTVGTPVPVSIIGGSGEYSVSVSVALDLPDGATSWCLWRMAFTEAGFTKVGNFTTSITDDGSTPNDPCPNDPGHGPRTVNTTNATNSVTVAISPEDVDLVRTVNGTVSRWRLYRSFTSGVYDNGLVHEVIETTTEDSDILLTAWTDTGLALAVGTPPPRSQTLIPPSLTPVGYGDALPTVVAAMPDGWPFILTSSADPPVFYVLLNRSFVAVAGGGGGGSGEIYPVDEGPILTDDTDDSQWRLGVSAGHLTITEV